MSKKNKRFNRRQFVKRSAMATGIVAASSTLASKIDACPIWYDDHGKIQDWFCIVDIDDSNPVYSLYTWKNCRTDDLSHSLGDPGEPLGDCGNAPNDASCYQGLDMEEWDRIAIDGSEYLIMPNSSQRMLATAVTELNRKRRDQA